MPHGNDMKVLVIEDDLDTQANLTDILELDGYTVEVASSVQDTLRPRDWPSLFAIILDRRLPDGSADSLLPKLRELAPRAAVIVVTGNADLAGAIGVIRHGIADFIPKPVDAEMLRASLARAVRIREMEERSRQDERLATIGRMMASVAHESRNALQRIQASTELLELALSSNAEGLKDVGKIQSAASDLQALLEEIRGFAAPIHLHREPTPVHEVWQVAWDHLADSQAKRDAELISHIETDEVTCLIDTLRMQQVFRNLFENSLAACPSPAKIRVICRRTRRDGRLILRVRVEDNGPGFSAPQMEQLFEPFFTTKPEGTGLGLAIIKRIVEAHGGKIRVDLNLTEGASFTIDLPVCDLPEPFGAQGDGEECDTEEKPDRDVCVNTHTPRGS